ncbi:hypothetical protein QR680_017313 [Steinernema hermaphroditum]|uniref:Major facilitator superfamily (MFS) profile domain-containing protein n=1 Tax=Steinernema hermaphroditum TaxID=289476 RepID=A0AA39HE37_9BILA|nr:hypothetical protein QR680_017313 [Steinernema hermaphroditum]
MIGDDSPLILQKQPDGPPQGMVPPGEAAEKSAAVEERTRRGRLLASPLRIVKGRTRFLVLLLAALAITATRSNDLTFSFTVICMTSNSSVNNNAPLEMSPFDVSLIFGASGLGAIVALLPAILALHRFGARTVLGVLMLLSSVATLLMPHFGYFDPLWMIPFRTVQGMGIAVVMPVLGYISGQWSPIDEIGNFVTVLSSAGQLSQIFTMPVAAQLCVSTGWSSVYTLHGVLSLAITVAFFFFFRNDPRSHPWIGEKEVFKITRGEMKQSRKERRRIPYIAIVRSKAVWAIWIAFIGNTFAFQLIVQFMPTYLNKVMDVGIRRTGMAAILPPISQLIVKVAAGYVSDRISFISERRKLQIFNSIAMCGCGLCLLPIGFLEKEQTQLALFCFISSISCLGLVASGSLKSSTQIARSYAHMIMAPVQFIICCGMLVVPFVVNRLAPNNEVSEWRVVFFSVCVVLFVTNCVFCLLCSADPEAWAVRQPPSGDKELQTLPIEEGAASPSGGQEESQE